eukprot:g14230.t1
MMRKDGSTSLFSPLRILPLRYSVALIYNITFITLGLPQKISSYGLLQLRWSSTLATKRQLTEFQLNESPPPSTIFPFECTHFLTLNSVGTGVTGYRQAVFSSIQMDEVRQQLRLEANTSTSLCVCNSPELRSGIQLCASVTIRNNKEDIDESATSTRIAALAFKCRQCKKMIPQCQQQIRVDWTKRSIRPSTSRISTCLECRYDGRKRRDDPKFSTFTPSAVVDESNAVTACLIQI